MSGEEGVVKSYYRSPTDIVDGLKYRLEGRDVIESVMDMLNGGVKAQKGSAKVYFEEHRLMNGLGIARVKFFLQSAVNKINHLTKYANEERINRQVKPMIKSFVHELVLNAKRWAPEACMTGGVLINRGIPFHKVRNMRLIVQVIENSIYQSMLRGTEGFEAELLSKSWDVHEVVDNPKKQEKTGFLGLFGRKRGDEFG